MRLQLSILLAFIVIWTGSMGQAYEDSILFHPTHASVDILYNYYDQDGIHSAVTGGQGTEKLTDNSSRIIVYVPVDSTTSIRWNGGANYYTSASSDRIDARVSSASAEDTRVKMHMDVIKYGKQSYYSGGAGGSIESDYLSTSVSAGYGWVRKDRNRSYSATVRYFYDTWLVMLPDELRGDNIQIPNDPRRKTLQWMGSAYFVLGKRASIQVNPGLVYQQGLLYTPFQRVYFKNEVKARMEYLPSERIKLPLGIQYNQFVTDWMITRLFVRHYSDSWGLNAHTVKLEVPLILGRSIRIYPNYRYHYQSGISYFYPYGVATDQTYYTSDYDLSNFSSHRIGFGIRIQPLFGIGRFHLNKRSSNLWIFRQIDVRVAQYYRSDGLSFFTGGIGMKFRLDKP